MVGFEQRAQLRVKGRTFRLAVSGHISDGAGAGSLGSAAAQGAPAAFGHSAAAALASSGDASMLSVSLEELDQPQPAVWRCDFSPAYVEEVTKKTGNFKKFHIFVEMLLSAMQKVPSPPSHAVSPGAASNLQLMQPNSTVTLDLLTAQDLDVVQGAPSPAATDSKIYLIVTYAVAFDRVHYPLPLSKVPPAALLGDVAQLALQNQQLSHDLSILTRVDGV
nr:Coiled-coil domain-containing protein 61 [Polyrhizophydium stewartii]